MGVGGGGSRRGGGGRHDRSVGENCVDEKAMKKGKAIAEKACRRKPHAFIPTTIQHQITQVWVSSMRQCLHPVMGSRLGGAEWGAVG